MFFPKIVLDMASNVWDISCYSMCKENKPLELEWLANTSWNSALDAAEVIENTTPLLMKFIYVGKLFMSVNYITLGIMKMVQI